MHVTLLLPKEETKFSTHIVYNFFISIYWFVLCPTEYSALGYSLWNTETRYKKRGFIRE